MFGLVVSNDLPMMSVFWEITTLCSFLLIGYTRTEETIGYAFDALNMNLLGGLGFSVAMLLLAGQPDGMDLARLTAGPAGAALLPAIALLCLAGITKSAQMPFSPLAAGRDVRPLPHLGPAPFEHDGQGWRLPAAAPLAGDGWVGVGMLVAFVGS